MNENNHPENNGGNLNPGSGTQKQTFRSGNFSPVITQRRSAAQQNPAGTQNAASAGRTAGLNQRNSGQSPAAGGQTARRNVSNVPLASRGVRIPAQSAPQTVRTAPQNPARQASSAASQTQNPPPRQGENQTQVFKTPPVSGRPVQQSASQAAAPQTPQSRPSQPAAVPGNPPVRQNTGEPSSAGNGKNTGKKQKKSLSKRKKRIPTAVEYNQAQLRKMERAESTSSALSSLVKAVIYIVAILVVSGFLSYFGVSVGNDVFALMKTGDPVEITISDDTQTSDLSKLLKENGVIAYPTIFELYASLRGGEKGYEFLGGTYTVSAENNYDELLAIFEGPKKVRETVKITIKEGSTVNDIITLFVDEYGMGTREGFIDAIQNYDFDYWFIPDPSTFREGRTYRLEGYLYPDTYQFYTDWSEVAILYKILDNFNVKFDEKYQARCQEIGWSVDDVLTLASMIQMEGKLEQEYSTISSVFHNRLNNPAQTNGMLGSDATIQYVLTERHEDLTQEELDLDNPYNTYLYRGLPPGPISNPTYLEIIAAIFPKETNYFYFVSESSGKTLFAETYEEHLKNKALVQSTQ